FVTSGTPSVGAIAVWGAQSGYSIFGHVAIVKSVQPDSYTVSEQNFQGAGIVDQRTIPWPDPRISGFIPIPGGAPGSG
ncbi:MAG TPA: CHAP domain-containing protein, partial [Chloroflexota bacterium]